MNNLEALRASVMHPVEDATLQKVLFDRGLHPKEDYIISYKKLMDLCTADLMVILVTAPAISEGGYSISLADKATLKATASGIYQRYGMPDPFTAKPTVKGVRPW